jgi:hypothetical protein
MGENKFGNWIPDQNRWSLPAPPDFVLEQLASFDSYLVIVPSRKQAHYLLARKRQFTAGLGAVALMENKHPDTNMLHAYGLVPIAPLVFRNGIDWSQRNIDGLFAHLRATDSWTHAKDLTDTSLNRMVDTLEYNEQRAEQKEHRTLWSNFHHRGRDAYRSLAARMGWRNKRASDYHGHARPTNGGTVQVNDRRRVTLT